MADLSQHSNYTGEWSGLVNNLWLTLAIAGACLVGHEIEVRVPRRRGWQGTRQRVWTRIWGASRRSWARVRARRSSGDGGGRLPSPTQVKAGRDEKAPPGGGRRGSDWDEKERARLGDRESWEFGYIYQPKAWSINPSSAVSKWPLMWAWDALRVREADMPPIWGGDITLHMRFLRGCLFYTLMQLFIVLPILGPLHILYAPSDVAPTSMIRASVSSLVQSSGSRWLWVHSLLVWWVTATWLITVVWITWGGVGYRRREVARLKIRVEEARAKVGAGARGGGGGDDAGTAVRIVADSGGERAGSGVQDGQAASAAGGALAVSNKEDSETIIDEPPGIKRFRTLMVLNIPPSMRDEETLQNYFDHYLHRHRRRLLSQARTSQAIERPSTSKAPTSFESKRKSTSSAVGGKFAMVPPLKLGASSHLGNQVAKSSSSGCHAPGSQAPADVEDDEANEGDDVEEVELDEMETEVEEVVLVRKLASLLSLRERRTKVLRELELAHVKLARRVLSAVASHKRSMRRRGADWTTPAAINHAAGDEEDEAKYIGLKKQDRLDILTRTLWRFVDDEPDQLGHGMETVWEVLQSLPRTLLDPYQALTHLRLTTPFRKNNAPLIDYLNTKLAYLTLLLDEARAKPLHEYSASSAAFVTFRDARTARLAAKVLDVHPKRRLACRTYPAPHWIELLWPRLGLSVYRSEFVRGWVVFLGVWAFTIAWIFPVTLFCALTSLSNIAGFLPPLKSWLDANPRASSAITSLAPVILVALLTIAICPILLVIANKAETIVTRLGIHNSVLERFWKFLMVNGVVFFAIGQSAIEAYLTAFQRNDFDPLPIVASAFPTAAPYFASYILLQVAIQPCFELFRFGLPAIVYWFGTRWSTIPRQRFSRTEHPTFSHFSQLPYQLLGGAIMHLFMLLNPMVIPFTLVYYATCFVVWKRQFTYVYGRLYENHGRRSCIRILRYSLDALALGQFVLFAFFILNLAQGEAISTGILFFITLGIKLIITRALKQRFDNLEIEEADIHCPPVAREDGAVLDAALENELEEGKDLDARHQQASLRLDSHYAKLKHRFHAWVHKYAYDSTTLPPGYKKPIPFDWLTFAWLDRYFSYPLDTAPTRSAAINQPTIMLTATSSHTEVDDTAEKAIKLVGPHHKLVPWEDIPPDVHAKGYDNQPAYTDPYDDFLWLPRDPLSALDLDDTVEMRASLTTSAGGSGVFASFEDDDEGLATAVGGERRWEEVLAHSAIPGTPGATATDMEVLSELSPGGGSERGLMDAIDASIPSPEALSPVSLPEHIGSEVNEGQSLDSVRRGTIKFAQDVQSIFRRSRADTTLTVGSDSVPMRALSRSSGSHVSAPSIVLPVTDSPELVRAEAGQNPLDEHYLNPGRSRSHSGASPLASVSHPPHSAPPIPEGATAGPTIETISPTTPVKPIASGSRITFSHTQADLGRSPSGRRPILNHRGSGSSATTPNISRIASPLAPAPSPSIRSASAFSARDRSFSALSAQQQALLREVMEEERLASQSAKEVERSGLETEREEIRKERERSGQTGPSAGDDDTEFKGRRRGSSSVSGTGSVRRLSAANSGNRALGSAGMVALAAQRFAGGSITRRRGKSIGAVSLARAEEGRRTSGLSTSALSVAAVAAAAGEAGADERDRNLSGSASGREMTVLEQQMAAPRTATGTETAKGPGAAPGGMGGLGGMGI